MPFADGAAEIRVAGRDAMFIADEVRIEPPFVHAAGRWRRRLASGDAWSHPRSYTWNSRTVSEIRWATETERAA